MKKVIFRCCLLLVLVATASADLRGAMAKSADEQSVNELERIRNEATQILKHRVGIWDSRWEFVDGDGNVTREILGVESSKLILGDKVVEGNTTIPEIDFVGKSFNYFHPIKKVLFFFSISETGDHWILTEEVGSGLMVSEPHLESGGGTRIIRFKTLSKTPTAVDVLREDSLDGGETWKPVFYQYLRKQN